MSATLNHAGRRRRICFVAPATYPVLSRDRSIREVGGAQVQQSILAREFVRRGYDVSMVSMNYGQTDGIEVDGIKIHRAHTPTEGLPVLRFVHPRMTSIWSAMRRADADIYYQRTAGALTGIMVAFAKMHGRISVYAGASDRDFFSDVPHVAFARDRSIYRWALRRADLVVAQTEAQREMCSRTFGRDPALIRSCYAHQGRPGNPAGTILWVGNVIKVKRAELFVELARALPQYRFKLVGGTDEAILALLRQQAAGLDNIEFTGFVPFADIEQHFDDGAMLVNTSSNEGFPNTFLQAWSRGMPTVSFFDPHAEWSGRRVGCVVGSMDDMVRQVQALMTETGLWRSHSALVSAYFDATFSVAKAVDAYEAEFASVGTRLASRPLAL
jgi:glycosyltransferase involved in cell wall biosynthesis